VSRLEQALALAGAPGASAKVVVTFE